MTTNTRIGANASETRLSLVEETVWATTPTSPSFTNLRFTGETLAPAKTTVRSNEIRPDRNVTDEIQTGRMVSGDLNFELSYETFDDLFRSALFGNFTGSPANTLKNGIAPTAFTAERTLALPGGTSEYHRFVGLMANTMSLNITAGQIVTGSFGMMGRFGGRGSTALSGSTYATANQNQVLNAAANFASLTVAGSSPTPRIRSLTLSATNNLRNQDEVGDLDLAGLAPGRFELSGTMEAYFESGALFQSFLDHDDLSLSFIIGTTTPNRYRITVPTLVLTGNPGANATGNDADVMLTLSFTALLDRLTSPRLDAALMIERAV